MIPVFGNAYLFPAFAATHVTASAIGIVTVAPGAILLFPEVHVFVEVTSTLIRSSDSNELFFRISVMPVVFMSQSTIAHGSADFHAVFAVDSGTPLPWFITCRSSPTTTSAITTTMAMITRYSIVPCAFWFSIC